jgi:arylsulfatase A-like enzyme
MSCWCRLLMWLIACASVSAAVVAAADDRGDRGRRDPGSGGQRPNIVFIMADDLGYTDLSCQGSGYYETPHVDRLASQGLRLQNHHHCQNCAPTRAALMTGQYAPRTGIYTVGNIDRFDWWTRTLRPVDNRTQLPLGRTTIAQCLRDAGYATGMFGKWHLGDQGDYHPGRRGFDEAIVSDGQHFDFPTIPKTDHPPGQYLADFLTDRAVDFIERNRDRPFFLYLPHFGVHAPREAKANWIEHFRAKRPANGHRDPVYAAMIASVDESVGRVLETLDRQGLSASTVVIFTSDNGGVGGYRREGIVQGNDVTDNAPLRSGKGSLYDGGTRVPFLVCWPGRIAANAECDQPTIHVDLFPTLLELAGANPPQQVLDGESLMRLFLSPQSSLKRDAIFQHFPGYLGAGPGQWRTTPVSVVQQGDWKLMEFLEEGRLELYDLRADVGETRNLVREEPAKAHELQARLYRWRADIRAPMPTPNVPRASRDGKSPAADAMKPELAHADRTNAESHRADRTNDLSRQERRRPSVSSAPENPATAKAGTKPLSGRRRGAARRFVRRAVRGVAERPAAQP